jgi:TMEM175 potassium channel family protein
VGTGRLETFSDGVFAIAITLLILEIRPPEDFSHLARGLLDLWPSYAAYAASFLLIGGVWVNHHAMFRRIARADRWLLLLNLLLLLDVAFLPFPTAVLAEALREGEGEVVACVLYGATLTIGGVFFNSLWAYAASHGGRLLRPEVAPAAARGVGRRFVVGPTAYAIATLLAFASPWASLAVFVALTLFYLVEGAEDRRGRPAG